MSPTSSSSGLSTRPLRRLLAGVLLGVLVGGGLMAVTPAGAQVSQAAATSWKKVWKKNLRPLAVKTFYTKAQSDAAYQPKGAYEPAGSGYTKAETYSRAETYARGETYSRAEIDARLAPLVNSVAATAGGDQTVGLTPASQVIRSVSLMPPANGTVVVTSSAYVWATAAGDVVARCSLGTGATVDGSAFQYVNIDTAALAESDSVAGTRAFPATKGTLLTVNLVCDVNTGSAAVSDSSLTAIFAPS